MHLFPRLLLTVALPLSLCSVLLAGCSGTSDTTASPGSPSPGATTPAPKTVSADPAFAALEGRYGARLGVYAVDTGDGRTVGYRSGERFAFASTLKVLAAGMVLERETDAQLDEVVRYDASDLLSYAPVTSVRLATGMPVRDIIAAALQQSDNTAMNLLLERLGGPAALEAALRDLGDEITNVDRVEPDLNSAVPGDTRDTTTPESIAEDLRELTLGDTLTDDRERLLADVMVGNTIGGPYIRAGVPAGWKVGDKTGNGGYGTRNDIALVWPPGRPPIVLALLSDRGRPDAASNDALLADAARAAVAALAR